MIPVWDFEKKTDLFWLDLSIAIDWLGTPTPAKERTDVKFHPGILETILLPQQWPQSERRSCELRGHRKCKEDQPFHISALPWRQIQPVPVNCQCQSQWPVAQVFNTFQYLKQCPMQNVKPFLHHQIYFLSCEDADMSDMNVSINIQKSQRKTLRQFTDVFHDIEGNVRQCIL